MASPICPTCAGTRIVEVFTPGTRETPPEVDFEDCPCVSHEAGAPPASPEAPLPVRAVPKTVLFDARGPLTIHDSEIPF